MPRDIKAYINDILDSIDKIERYTENMSFAEFQRNDLIQDAVIRNLEIIGEAIKKFPLKCVPAFRISSGKKLQAYVISLFMNILALILKLFGMLLLIKSLTSKQILRF